MKDKILHGNNAKIDAKSKIESVFQTSTITSKQQSTTKSNSPVTNQAHGNVELAKKEVDENHK